MAHRTFPDESTLAPRFILRVSHFCPLSQRIPDAEWFTPHGQSEGLFCPRKARYPGLVSTGPRGVGMHWQRLSTDFWVWDLAARSNVSTHCLAREQRFSEYPPPLGLAGRLLITGPRGGVVQRQKMSSDVWVWVFAVRSDYIIHCLVWPGREQLVSNSQ